MKVGTKSVLFGVHCIIWHPLTVALAWFMYYRRWPQAQWQWIGILVHDIGYWGCNDMDGECGSLHPWMGAQIAKQLVDKKDRRKVSDLIRGHSATYARINKIPLSDLYAPDKISVLYDPIWFYLLRARLSGEIHEFKQNAPEPIRSGSDYQWLVWYREKVRKQFYGAKAKN